MAFKLKKVEVGTIEVLMEKYELARGELAERLDEIATAWEDEFGEKSEKWQEGENGQAAQERIDMVRGWFDEMPDTLDFNPEDLL